MKNIYWSLLAVATLLALPNSAAYAADGDNLRVITADSSGTACASGGIGVGIAFDGTNLLISCYYDNTVTAVSPADGSQVAVHPISGASSLGALAWDNGRQLLWACSGFSTVGTIDLGTNVFTPIFASGGCFDGLAYDGADDTIWSSQDADYTIHHYTAAGVWLSSQGLPAGWGSSCGNSGIAVGGANLYLADNGCSNIWVADKGLTSAALFASFPARLEDMECDNVTFAGAGKGAIWSKDAYDNTLNAWEIPAGSCSFGGGGGAVCGDGVVDAGEQCDDGNTNNGDGCSARCEVEVVSYCGDGTVDAGEQCDDGNAVDGDGCSSVCAIENEAPSCAAATVSSPMLWPPNHQMVPLSISVSDPDGDTVTVTATYVAQDEAVNDTGVGAGNTSPDASLAPLAVRAERNGNPKSPGNGRVYHIAFTADDGNGGSCTGAVTVCVPHDERPGASCVDGGAVYSSIP